jgi:hypothetical protein
MIFIFIFIDLHVAVNNITLSSADMEIQSWVPFALLSSYKKKFLLLLPMLTYLVFT